MAITMTITMTWNNLTRLLQHPIAAKLKKAEALLGDDNK